MEEISLKVESIDTPKLVAKPKGVIGENPLKENVKQKEKQKEKQKSAEDAEENKQFSNTFQ